MAGFLRRLRRPKDAEPEGEAPAEPTEDPAGAPEEGGEIYAAEDLPAMEELPPTEDLPMEPEAPAPQEPFPEPTPGPALVGPSPPPPPLPQADRIAARSSIAPRRTTSTCFLCGTEMDGPWCPSCRMAWAE